MMIIAQHIHDDAKMMITKLTKRTNDYHAKMTMISTQQTNDVDDDHDDDDGDDDHNN